MTFRPAEINEDLAKLRGSSLLKNRDSSSKEIIQPNNEYKDQQKATLELPA